MRKSILLSSVSILYTALIVGILVIVNLLSINHHTRFDLTSQKYFSLSPQSKKVIKALDEKITIFAFVKQEESFDAIDLLDKYLSPMIETQIVDPDRKPSIAAKYNITGYNALIVETASGRREATTYISEESLTNAIVKATRDEEKKVYFMQGHNERATDSDGQQDWGSVSKLLKMAAYQVETINLFTTGIIPDDADLLVIAGPRNDFQELELDLIDKSLKKGMALLLTLDPGVHPNLEKFMKEYGVKIHRDHIIDPISQQIGFDPLVASVSSYSKHPIVKDIKAATFFPFARSITFDKENSNHARFVPFATTAAQSWGETDPVSLESGVVEYHPGVDHPGPRIIAGAISFSIGKSKEELKIGEKPGVGRIAIVGDSDFAANATIGLSSNKDLFQNIIGWLLDRGEQITVRPKSRGFNPIIFSDTALNTIFVIVVVLMPVASVVTGVLVRRRRKKA